MYQQSQRRQLSIQEVYAVLVAAILSAATITLGVVTTITGMHIAPLIMTVCATAITWFAVIAMLETNELHRCLAEIRAEQTLAAIDRGDRHLRSVRGSDG